MDTIKTLTVGTVCRQLGCCDQNAELGVSIGGLPLLLPIDSVSIRQNANNAEVIVFNIDEDNMGEILERAIEITNE